MLIIFRQILLINLYDLMFIISKWKPKTMQTIFYILMFICGASVSIFITFFINSGGIFLKNQNLIINQHQSLVIPDNNYLQVRDDYPQYSSIQNALDNDFLEVDRNAKARISAETFNKRNKIEDQKEALSSLKIAEEMRALGKNDKALKLFQHALSLAPKHPDVLIKYGEYLEHHRDIVTADRMYLQALSINPSHNQAIANRIRTANIVELIDQSRLAKLDEKRNILASIDGSNTALRRAYKEAYFQNVYHSVGIEGNTMSLAQTRSILETRMAVDGKSIDEHNEILGFDAAMKYINASLVNKNDYITLKDILEVHKRVLGHVDPIEGGEFRRTQVYVGGHTPPGPGDLAILLQRFEQWLNSEHALSMHPIKYAALAHYKLVHIHPFTDGNGRTSRLLMNTILMRAGYPPVIIPKQQRHKYYDYLQLANEGDIRPFIRFIADCTDKTLDLFLWATSELSHQVPMLSQNDYRDITPILDNTSDIDDNGGSGYGDTVRLGGSASSSSSTTTTSRIFTEK